ncbi:MAG: hypothetical protein KJO23_00270 [Bacteroidia bacterium]|nr:hypothetical protein [Bacteroidia bacterium]
MKTFKYIIVTLIVLLVASAALTSCAAPQNLEDNKAKIAGYTLKCKKELMQQKIANKKSKTVIATP